MLYAKLNEMLDAMVYSPEIKSDPDLFELKNKFSLWKTVQLFLKVLNVRSPTIPLLKIYPKEMKNCIPLQKPVCKYLWWLYS